MTDFDSLWPEGSAQRRYFPTFTGDASEYFRIWSVNALLTVVTLGVYLAWAKVRKRRYFYANTYLDGVPFDYLAKPGAILVGHLVLAAAILASNFSELFSPTSGGAVTVILYGFVPWLVYKAHRFRARNSSFRGVRFRFNGTAAQAYRVYGLLPGVYIAAIALLWVLTSVLGLDATMVGIASAPVGLTAALLYPYWIYLRRRYTFSNVAYGTARASFSGDPRFFYRVYFKALGLVTLCYVGVFFGIFALGASLGITGLGAAVASILFPLFLLSVISIYFVFDQYTYAHLTNHCWNNLKLGPLSFEATLEPGRLIWLRLTNIAATVATLGFAAPWAEIRRTKYIVESLCVKAPGGFDAVSQAEDSKEAAVGDAALDVLDLDVGW